MKTLLACVDTSRYAESVVDHAAWAAKPLAASVELLHVVQRIDAVAARHDHSGAMGLGAKSALLEELAAIDEQQSKLARQRGQDLQMKTLLACVDTSRYAESVVDHAAWAAKPLAASVELLHVVQRIDAVAARHDHSGAMGLGAKSALLEELAAIDEQQSKLARQRGQDLLQAASDRLRAGGVQDIVETHRHGGILETILEREADADLVILGKRGDESAFAEGHLGSQIERTVRESIRPVMMVPPAFRAASKALVAFDGGPTARQAVEFAARSPLLQDLTIEVLSVGTTDRRREADLAWAEQTLAAASSTRTVRVRSIEGSPEEAIPRTVEADGFDLVMMGAYGHSPLRRLLVGSTTTLVMRALHVPVLLFR